MLAPKDVTNDIYKISKAFAIRIVNMYKYLRDNQKEFVMSKQMLRSGTSIGANVNEARYAQSKADFISKMNISLKEASETKFWLELLYETDFINGQMFESVLNDCNRIIATLTKIIKTSKLQ